MGIAALLLGTWPGIGLLCGIGFALLLVLIGSLTTR